MASLAFQKFKAMEERSTMKGSDGHENDGESNSVARPPKRRSLIGSLASRFENDQQKEEKRRKQNQQKKVGILCIRPNIFYNFTLTPITTLRILFFKQWPRNPGFFITPAAEKTKTQRKKLKPKTQGKNSIAGRNQVATKHKK